MNCTYKAKCIDNGKWVEGLPHHCGMNTLILSDQIADFDTEWIAVEKWQVVDPATVGQYSGKDDDNGVPFFEGDRVFITLYDRNTGQRIVSGNAVVERRGCVFGFEWGHRKEFTTFDGFTINTSFIHAGNIHDDGGA